MKNLRILATILVVCITACGDSEQAPANDTPDMNGSDVGALDMSGEDDMDISENNSEVPADTIECFADVKGDGLQNIWVTAYHGGDILIPGRFRGDIDFGNGAVASNGDFDAYVAAFGPDCSVKWTFTFGGSGYDHATHVLPLDDGTFLVSGEFGEGALWGETALQGEDNTGFLGRLSASGEPMAAQAISGANHIDRVIAGPDGLVVTGLVRKDGADFGGGPRVGAGPTILILDENLDYVRDISWSGPANLHDIGIDGLGNVVGFGGIEGTVDLGDGSTVESTGDLDLVLVKYDTDGSVLWSKTMGGPGPEQTGNLTIGDDDEIYVTGAFSGDVDFGDGPASFIGGKDAFVARYSSDGELEWLYVLGGPGADWGLSVTLGPGGDVVATGSFLSDARVGAETLKARGLHDVWVVGFDKQTGNVKWGRQFGTTEDDISYAAHDLGGGEIVLTGDYSADHSFLDRALMTADGSFFVTRLKLQL